MPKQITKNDALKLGKKFNINFNLTPFDEWYYGLKAENNEHGNGAKNKLTHITNNKQLIARITIAHLLEHPRYYYYLQQMEKQIKF